MKEETNNKKITNLVILGSTGSIGRQALEVVDKYPQDFRVIAVAAWNEADLLAEQVKKYKAGAVAVSEPAAYQALKERLPGKCEVLAGIDGMCELASLPEADVVLVAVSGAVGIKPTIAAIEAHKRIALANKETLVAAGEIVMQLARDNQVMIIPVDSEHSAVYQCLAGERPFLKKIWLTASGGPFRDFTCNELEQVTVEMALKHPNWSMGPKITIDSASMMNKGLEVIEAHHLFAVDYDDIEVLVQKESVIHSMVELVDGSFLAHMGVADMRIPIQYALTWPQRWESPALSLDFGRLNSIHFSRVDDVLFPGLSLAYAAGRSGGTMPAVFNAANEVAALSFLGGRIKFTDIPVLVEKTMGKHDRIARPDLETILMTDAWARQTCQKLIKS